MPTTSSRRTMLRTAVLGRRAPRPPDGERPLRAVTGRIMDAGPHLLVLVDELGAVTRLPLADSTTVWHGGRAGPAALRPGRAVIVRMAPDGLRPDRIWVDITRVTGTLTACRRDSVEVDMGPHRGWTRVHIPPSAMGQVLVRHPHLEPGYLFDVIARDTADGPLAVRPATSQPGYHAADPPAPRPGPPSASLRGTVTWFGGTEGSAARGAAYPALDPEGDAGGCGRGSAGCAGLPFLSLGSPLRITNECGGRTAVVPVSECGCAAARFCDRCVRCGTSKRGRLAELTAVSFVELGGDLDGGCFNAILSVG